MVRKAALLAVLVAAVALTGCSSNKTTDSTNSSLSADQTSVQLTLVTAPELLNDGLFDVGVQAGFSLRPNVGTLSGSVGDGAPETEPGAPSTERHWWREISPGSGHPTFDYQFTARDSAGRPTLAHVTVHRHFTGTFHVAWTEVVPSTAGTDSLVPHQNQRPFADHWSRQLWFARMGTDSTHEHPWRLVASSGVSVTSETGDAGAQPAIQSVRVQAGAADTTFTDPAAAITWHKLWCLPTGSPVTVTVTTTAPDDIVVLMDHDSRLLMTANGDNTYTATCDAPAFAGLKHFGVNALSHGTLFDPAGGYHSNAWMYPYLNRGEAYRD
jgi:hypothetical protein